jgi:tetratricopeptide (TPR) repeat protein
MKTKLLILTLVFAVMAASVSMAAKIRKLPAGAYLKSAKIHIVSGDLERYKMAIAMLDSLQMHYGHHSEALYLMAQIQVDYIGHQPDPVSKRPYVEAMVAYFDTLATTCDKNNKDVPKKNKGSCKNYLEQADSLRAYFWQTFYNDGVEQLRLVEQNKEELDGETDSVAIDFITKSLWANVDSCIQNMDLTIIVDPSDHRPYIGAGQAYEHKGEYQKANDMMVEGLAHLEGEDRMNLLLPIAYNYTSLEEYCKAADYMQQFVDGTPVDDPNLPATMGNLAICYNNCGAYERAFQVNQRVLANHPENTNALTNVVRYYNQMARDASDSVRNYQGEESKEQVKTWTAVRNDMFDSSIVYAKQVFDLQPDDPEAVGNYALAAALREKYDEAVIGFTRLVELVPDDPDHWISLGDVNLYLKKFDDAIAAYEKVVELEPDNKSIWQQLIDLYENEGMTKKKNAARAKLKGLN